MLGFCLHSGDHCPTHWWRGDRASAVWPGCLDGFLANFLLLWGPVRGGVNFSKTKVATPGGSEKPRLPRKHGQISELKRFSKWIASRTNTLLFSRKIQTCSIIRVPQSPTLSHPKTTYIDKGESVLQIASTHTSWFTPDLQIVAPQNCSSKNTGHTVLNQRSQICWSLLGSW